MLNLIRRMGAGPPSVTDISEDKEILNINTLMRYISTWAVLAHRLFVDYEARVLMYRLFRYFVQKTFNN